MKEKIKDLLVSLDLYDHFRIFKDKFFKHPIEKELFKKRYNFYSKIIKKGDVCFDIGANYGNRSEIFLLLGANVIAAEPQPMAVNFLKRKFKNRISLIEKAVGAESGKSKMYLSPDSPLSSLSSDWISEVKKKRFNHTTWNRRIEVEITTLDNLIELYGIPDFCKIDVEGYELEVLKGLTVPIKMMSFEYIIPEFTDKAIECINYLDKMGKIICNYSQGETLQFGLENWLNPSEFVEIFRGLPSKGIIDGDIYVKYKDI